MGARFDNVETAAEGGSVRVRFRTDRPAVIGWQLYDPATAAFLWEGEWSHRGTEVDLEVPLPEEDGSYRIQIAPIEDRSRFVAVDAEIEGGRIARISSRIATPGASRRERSLQAIPKAFAYPARSIWQNRKLIASLVRRDITARYRGSIGGVLWTVLNPLLLMTAYFFVFGIVLQSRFAGDPSRSGFVLYFLAGMLPWLAFSEAAGRAPFVILEHRNFVKKLVFPLDILPLNAVLAALATQAFALLIFVAMLLFARGTIPLTAAWLPLVLIPQLLFTAGVAWILAAAGVFVRDLGQIMSFLLTLWFFLTPICYPESALPPEAAAILSANPMFLLVRAYRAIFLEGRAPDMQLLIVVTAISGALAILGYAWFHKLRKSFADVI